VPFWVSVGLGTGTSTYLEKLETGMHRVITDKSKGKIYRYESLKYLKEASSIVSLSLIDYPTLAILFRSYLTEMTPRIFYKH
jgi:hypothetical protein